MRIPRILAKLGTVLDVRVEQDGARYTLQWRRGAMWLCTDARGRRLYLVPKPRGEERDVPSSAKGAVGIYRQFTDFSPSRVTLGAPRIGEPEPRGRVCSIAYRSQKWSGTPQDYEHEAEGRLRLVELGEVFVISGGTLRVTPAGIQG